ncbi:hypothetical protein [Vulcanisaeta thermophila]|nr:hypothetical protein [Vulcanisaeta thermophila]
MKIAKLLPWLTRKRPVMSMQGIHSYPMTNDYEGWVEVDVSLEVELPGD